MRLRFDEKTRALNACSFAVMTVFSSGISMYAMARLIQASACLRRTVQQLGWAPGGIFTFSIVLSAVIVLLYIFLGGLTSAIYNEVLQFFLIIAGFLPLVLLGLKNIGGWAGLKASVPVAYMHEWKGVMHSNTNPMGIEIIGIGMGLGFVLGSGYWCTDFLVIQTAMASKDMESARRVPLIAAVPKMLFPVSRDSAGTAGDRPAHAAHHHGRDHGVNGAIVHDISRGPPKKWKRAAGWFQQKSIP